MWLAPIVGVMTSAWSVSVTALACAWIDPASTRAHDSRLPTCASVVDRWIYGVRAGVRRCDGDETRPAAGCWRTAAAA